MINRLQRLHRSIRNQEAEVVSDWKMVPADWWAVLSSALGAFLAILDIQITNASLREIQGAFGLDYVEVGWISTAYLVAEIAVIPLTGAASAALGVGRCLFWSGLGFLGASALCGIAWSFESLVLFRAIQGITGGALVPLSFQTILLRMPPSQRTVGMAIFGVTATLAPTLGPTIGGYLTDEWGWRSSFMINLAPGALMLWGVTRGFPRSNILWKKLRDLDGLGALALGIALACLTFVLEDGPKQDWFASQEVRGAALLGILAGIYFGATYALGRRTLLDLSLLKERNFRISAWITTLSAAALFGGIYALSLFLGQVQRYRATEIGKVMMWVGLPQLLVMPLVPWLVRYFDSRFLIGVGLACFALSNFLNTGVTSGYAGDEFRASLVIRALGQPLFLIPLSMVAMASVSPRQSGDASALFNVLRNLGGSIGIALTGTLLRSREAFHSAILREGVDTRFSTVEKVVGLKRLLTVHLGDPVAAEGAVQQAVRTLSTRESTIGSFADTYLLLTVLVVMAWLAVFRLSRTNNSQESTGGFH